MPSIYPLYIIRGAIYGLQNKWERSIADMRTGFEMHLRPPGPFSGSLAALIPEIDEYVTTNPKNARAYAVRGFIKLFQAKRSEADKDFERSFALDPELKMELTELIQSVIDRPVK